jgi:hypothetical protein
MAGQWVNRDKQALDQPVATEIISFHLAEQFRAK